MTGKEGYPDPPGWRLCGRLLASHVQNASETEYAGQIKYSISGARTDNEISESIKMVVVVIVPI